MIDTVRLNINAGSGGNGCSSFLREKYRPKGGPNGGDGGDGGSAYLVGDPSINTLLHIKFNSTIYVVHGGHGKGKNRRGANGPNQHIPVPIGTVVYRITVDGRREFRDGARIDNPRLGGGRSFARQALHGGWRRSLNGSRTTMTACVRQE